MMVSDVFFLNSPMSPTRPISVGIFARSMPTRLDYKKFEKGRALAMRLGEASILNRRSTTTKAVNVVQVASLSPWRRRRDSHMHALLNGDSTQPHLSLVPTYIFLFRQRDNPSITPTHQTTTSSNVLSAQERTRWCCELVKISASLMKQGKEGTHLTHSICLEVIRKLTGTPTQCRSVLAVYVGCERAWALYTNSGSGSVAETATGSCVR